MSNKKHPLDDTFNVAKEDVLNYEDKIELPEIKDLNTIIDMALTAYKEQMEIVELVEPKNKIKYLEIAERFLGQAKDAMYKKEYLIIQERKLRGGKKGDKEPEEGKQEEIPRSSLFKMIDGGKN